MMDRSQEVKGVLELMKENGVEVTCELILLITKIVFGYKDDTNYINALTPLFENLSQPMCVAKGE